MVESRFNSQSSSGVRSETVLDLKESLQERLRTLESESSESFEHVSLVK